MGAKTLAFEQNLIGAARRQGEKKGGLARTRHLSAPTNSERERAAGM
jgi:hypothetical protein